MRKVMHSAVDARRHDGDGVLLQLARPKNAGNRQLLTDVLKERMGSRALSSAIGWPCPGAWLPAAIAVRRRSMPASTCSWRPKLEGSFDNTLADARSGESLPRTSG